MSRKKKTDFYELTYILNPLLSEEQVKEIIERINEFIKANGGEIVEVQEWGLRRLAYPIEKKRNGYYVNLYFRASTQMIPKLERVLQLDENVMRHLVLRYDAKMMRYYEKKKRGEISVPGEVGASETSSDNK